MEYCIVRMDQVDPNIYKALKDQGKVISHKELIEMNAAARLEIARGNKHLNGTLLKASDCFVQQELAAELGSGL